MRTRALRSSLRLAPAAAVLLATAAAPGAGRDATHVLVGNTFAAAALRAALSGPRRSDAPVPPMIAARSQPLASLQDAVASGATVPDLVLMPLPDIALACAQDLVRPLPGVADCARPALSSGLVLADDPARDGDSPRWTDFWDVTRLPGRRGLPRQARGTLELALLADGVAPADIYRTLRTEAGATRAFRKLEQLRPYVEWWTDGLAARRALQDGSVLMTTLPLDAVGDARGVGTLALDGDGVLAEDLGWAIPVAAAHPSAALDLLAYADDDPVAGVLASHLALRSVVAPPANAPPSPRPLLTLDTAFWRDHQALDARFRAWLAS